MGPPISWKTIEMKIVLLFVIAAAAYAAQEGSMPEEFFVEKMNTDGTFAEASDRADSLVAENEHLDEEAKRNACVKAADASINNVYREVQNANSNLRKARRARVSWNFSFESLSEGRCGAFYRHGNWQAAKKKVANRQRTLNQAKANLNSAKANLKVQIANAKKVRNTCRCNVQKNTKNQLKIAKKLTAERQKTILREMMVKCLVSARAKGKKANAAAAKCKNLRVSAAYNRKLNLTRTRWASGVSGADCNKNKYRGGGQGIRYNGMFYRTLDGSNHHGTSNGCENSYRNVPNGCTPV